MRHRKKRGKLKRSKSHRDSLLRNLARALVLNGEITTTLARARALRPFVERLITKAVKGYQCRDKKKKLHYFRLIIRRISDRAAASILFRVWAKHFELRNGGYTRIIKLGQRLSDAAPIAIIQMVGDHWFWSPESTRMSEASRALKSGSAGVREALKSYEMEQDDEWLEQRDSGPLPNIRLSVFPEDELSCTLKVQVDARELNYRSARKSFKYPASFLIRLNEAGHYLSSCGNLPQEVTRIDDETLRVLCQLDISTQFTCGLSSSKPIKENPPIVRILRENGATVRRGRLSF